MRAEQTAYLIEKFADLIAVRISAAAVAGLVGCTSSRPTEPTDAQPDAVPSGRSQYREVDPKLDVPDADTGSEPKFTPAYFCPEVQASKKELTLAQSQHKLDPDGCDTGPLRLPREGGLLRFDPHATRRLRHDGNLDDCCYTRPGPRKPIPGRALADGDQLLLPALSPVGGHRRDSSVPARVWLENARYEFASVRSFLEAREQLRLLDAPRDLTAAYSAAATEEQDHARVCLAVATRLGAGRWWLGDMAPLRRVRLSALEILQQTFRDACLSESAATVVALTASRLSEVAFVTTALNRIAVDEAGHAALAWRTIGWAVTQLDPAERRAWRRWASGLRARDVGKPPGAGPHAPRGCIGISLEAWTSEVVWNRAVVPAIAKLLEAEAA